MPNINAPVSVSRVETLNVTLSDVVRRISHASSRVGQIANQFGCPSIPENPSAPVAKENTTDEYMGYIAGALGNLESIISRIDCQ